MRFIRKLWGWIKACVKRLLKASKDKGPFEVVEDVTKAAIGIASTGTVVFAAINGIRVALMKGKKATRRNTSGSGDELINNRKAGSLDEKLSALYEQSRNINSKSPKTVTQEDLDMLEEIAKTRNSIFKGLSPEDQLNLLHTEGFDFEAYRTKYRKRQRSGFRKSLRRVGEAIQDKPFREPVDYGWLNFIMRPLDDLICWLKNDPVPKQVKQIRLIEESDLKDLTCKTGEEAIQQIQLLNPYLEGADEQQLMNLFDDAQERAICAEEIFRHRRLKNYKKAVNAKMMDTDRGLSSQLLELMAEEVKGKGKKKKKKKSKKSKDALPSYNTSEKKKSKKSNDDGYESDADKEARKMYEHFLKAAAAGKNFCSGYHLDRVL